MKGTNTFSSLLRYELTSTWLKHTKYLIAKTDVEIYFRDSAT